MIWATIAVLAALSPALNSLSTWTSYGKCLAASTPAASTGLAQRWSVPKAAFAHFYIIGGVVNAIAVLGGWPSVLAALPEPVRHLLPCGHYATTAGVLFQLHLLRRLYECKFVHVFSADAVMPLPVYLGGVAHYVLAPLSFVVSATPFDCRTCSRDLAFASSPVHPSPPPSDATQWLILAGIVVFVACNVLQHQCHVHLASLRPTGRPASGYGLPHTPPFRAVACPHYLAEIGLYLSLWLVTAGSGARGGASPWLLLSAPCALLLAAWSTVNLCVTGVKTRQWYMRTFKDFPRHRAAVIPGLV